MAAVTPGDAVSLIAPAGPVDEPLIRSCCRILESWKLRPIVHPQAWRHQAYLAGSDEDRAAAVLDAFADRSTTAVICLRGGYGCARILPMLNERLDEARATEEEGERGVSVQVGGDRQMQGACAVTITDASMAGKVTVEREDRGSADESQARDDATYCMGGEVFSGDGVCVEEPLQAAWSSTGRPLQLESNSNGSDNGNGDDNEGDNGSGREGPDCSYVTSTASTATAAAAAADGVRRKRFFGFSDITALHCFLQARFPSPPLISFHSPLPASSLFASSTPASQLALKQSLFGHSPSDACPPLKGRCLQLGYASERSGERKVRGRLLGGNLTVLCSLIGSPACERALGRMRCGGCHSVRAREGEGEGEERVEMRGGDCTAARRTGCRGTEEDGGLILFLEDVNECEYRVDRMVTQLRAFMCPEGRQDCFGAIRGLVLGAFVDLHKDTDCPTVHTSNIESWFWLTQLALPPSLPILSDVPIGHISDNRCLAIGSMVEMDLMSACLRTLY